MWTLILTILWYHAPTTTSVPGFTTYEACNAAAQAEKKAFASLDPIAGAYAHVYYVCAKLN